MYFVLLADRFLNKNGTLAAVLPFTTFTGHAFHPLIEFLTKYYSVKSIVVGLGQSSFSEDTSLTECLLVASKSPARHDCSFRLVGTKLPPSLWTDNEIKTLADAVTKEQFPSNTDTHVSKVVPQKELLPEGQTLSLLYLRLNPDFEQAWESLQGILSNSSLPMRTVKDWFADGLKMDEVYHGRDRPLRLGPKAILMCRNVERAIKNTDRLVLKSKDNSSYTFFDRFCNKTVLEFPKSEVTPALRRFPFLDSMDITNKTDFCVSKPGKATEKSMHTFYTKEMSKAFLRRLGKDSWKRIQANGSSKVAISARADLAAPGTKLVAFYSEEPYFLAGAYGYNVRGFKSETDEKLFVLWMNSTLALLQLLAKSTITRGSWVKLEQFTTEQVVLPNVSKLTESQRIKVEKMWKDFSKTTVSSLLEQLGSSNETRLQLDSAFLELLGVPKTQASQTAQKLEKGVLGAIQMLKATMKKGHAKKGAGKPSTKTLTEFLN